MRNKDVIIETFIENVTDLNKKIITQNFSYNQYVKDVDTKFSEDTNVKRTNKTSQKEQLKLQQNNAIGDLKTAIMKIWLLIATLATITKSVDNKVMEKYI